MKSEHRFSQGWAWPPDVREWVEEHIDGYTLNICAGRSRIGDVKVDMDPRLDPDVVADMNDLPFEHGTFDSVVSDPPWNLDYFDRREPFYEAVRMLKPGGILIYNAPWKPTSSWVTLEDSFTRVDDDWAEVSVLWQFRRHEHNSAGEVNW